MATATQRRWASQAIGGQVERVNVEPPATVERAIRQLEVIQPPHACAWCLRLRVPCRHVPGASVGRRRPAYGDSLQPHRRHTGGRED